VESCVDLFSLDLYDEDIIVPLPDDVMEFLLAVAALDSLFRANISRSNLSASGFDREKCPSSSSISSTGVLTEL
jgi:hypothetical protein